MTKQEEKLDWGYVVRYHEPRERTSKEPFASYEPAYIRQIDGSHGFAGGSFQIMAMDPEPEDPSDPRDLMAEMAGATSHWSGNGLHVTGWVEGEHGRMEDWGKEWHREIWFWRQKKESAG